MGYSIINDRFFVKLSDREYIPMIQTSSSNWYDPDNRRRARDWGVSTYVCEKGVTTNPDIISRIFDRALQSKVSQYPDHTEQDIRKSYGYYTACYLKGNRNTSFSAIKSYFVNGCKIAMTLDELAKHNIYLTVGTSLWSVRELAQKGLAEFPRTVVKSAEEFWSIIAAILLAHGNLDYLSVEFASEIAVENCLSKKAWERKLERRSMPEHACVKVDHYYSIYYPEKDGYFIKYTRSGFHYAHYPRGGKKFVSEKRAQGFLKKMRSQERFEVKRIDEQALLPWPSKKLQHQMPLSL